MGFQPDIHAPDPWHTLSLLMEAQRREAGWGGARGVGAGSGRGLKRACPEAKAVNRTHGVSYAGQDAGRSHFTLSQWPPRYPARLT